MAKLPAQRRRKVSVSAKPKTPSNDPPLLLPTTSTELYTPTQMEEMTRVRRRRYKDLLQCARSGDMESHFLFPPAKRVQEPTTKVRLSLSVKIELLDIYHYLKLRQDHVRQKVSLSTFGPMIGCYLPKSTLSEMLRSEAKLRAAAEMVPETEETENAEKDISDGAC
ncbi:hypothetical protein EC968_006032 [Mortierella alpina]|nr:hypothetical protein EC968_006032 [Mortierella alpina]